MSAGDYASVAEVTRVRVHQLDRDSWVIDAADDAGRYTARFWDAERDCATPLTRQRAIQLAPEFAASLGRPGLRIEIDADE